MAIPWDTTWRYVIFVASVFLGAYVVIYLYNRLISTLRRRNQQTGLPGPGPLYTSSGRPMVVIQQPLSSSQQVSILPGRDSVLVLSPQWTLHGQRRPDAQQGLALPPELVDRIPSFTLPKEEAVEEPKLDMERECVVCQEDFGDARLMRLPCFHIFHKACVRPWLLQHANCPTCRLPITPEILRGDVVFPPDDADGAQQPPAIAERGLPQGIVSDLPTACPGPIAGARTRGFHLAIPQPAPR